MGYPKLLRTFHQFFAKISVQTDTVYTRDQQSYVTHFFSLMLSPNALTKMTCIRPETVLILRSLTPFETLYLSRSSSRLSEVVNTATSGGSRNPPGATEGVTVARIALNELDSGRFDPLLLRSVARGVGSSLETFATRLENLVSDQCGPCALFQAYRQLELGPTRRSPRMGPPTLSTVRSQIARRCSTRRSRAPSGTATRS